MLMREAIDKDIPKILELLSTMDDEVMDLKKSLEIYEKTKEYPFYKDYVAEKNNDILGSCCLIIIDNIGHQGKKLAIVENVIVNPKYRGKGIGTFMMSYIMNKAREENCYKLMLSSNKKRIMAHKFYKELGFSQHGISFMVELL